MVLNDYSKKIIFTSSILTLNYIIDIIPLVLKTCLLNVILSMITFILIFGDKDKKDYQRVCFENLNLYYSICDKDQEISVLKSLNLEVKSQLQKQFFEKLREYQLKSGKCIFPFCENEKETFTNLCSQHQKYREEECCVCLEKFSDFFYPLSCGHFIHQDCVKDGICPLCKKQNLSLF